jgi:RimJ/RimL family protein N-acetyltransferase
VGNPFWPMYDIRATTPDLELRHLTEADHDGLAELLPADVELDPSAQSYAGLSTATNRGTAVLQTHWRSLGGWRPESWALGLGVFLDGALIGHQVVEAEDFVALRTVDSSSFLVAGQRGRGLGKQMRAAVLALAFGSLGARYAVTSAWSDNHASLGVSRALGYVDNGVSAHRRGDAAGELAHLRLTREAWLASPWPGRVSVSGMAACLPFFGL